MRLLCHCVVKKREIERSSAGLVRQDLRLGRGDAPGFVADGMVVHSDDEIRVTRWADLHPNVAMLFDAYLEKKATTPENLLEDALMVRFRVGGPGVSAGKPPASLLEDSLGGRRVGVLLVQLGGRRSARSCGLPVRALRGSRDHLSAVALRQIVAFLIAVARAPKSAETYDRIGWSRSGAGSRRQAELLERELLGAGRRPSSASG